MVCVLYLCVLFICPPEVVGMWTFYVMCTIVVFAFFDRMLLLFFEMLLFFFRGVVG